MELEVALEAFADTNDSINNSTKRILKRMDCLPLHMNVGGSYLTPSIAPTVALVECQTRPQTGRVWNIRKIGIFGSDPHTPVGNTIYNSSGTVTSPAGSTSISGTTATVPAGTYLVTGTVSVSGTVAAGDANNMALHYSTLTIDTPLLYPEPGQAPYSYTYTAAGGGGFKVSTINAGTASSVYAASVQAVPLYQTGFLPPVYADIYGGGAVDMMPINEPQAPIDCLANGVSIPYLNMLPRHAVWVKPPNQLYALVYNPPVNQQFVIVATVEEYPLDAVESLIIQ